MKSSDDQPRHGSPLAGAIDVRRVSASPVVPFGSVPGYGPIFNAGVIVHDGVYHLFARGVRSGYRRNESDGPRFLDYVSDILVFTSRDGRSYEFQQVLARGEHDGIHSFEDPRIQVIHREGGSEFLMSYTNLAPPAERRPWLIGLHRLDYARGRFALDAAGGGVVGPPGVPNKDAVVFSLGDGRVGLIHRIHPDMQLAIFDTLEQLWEPPAGYWDEHVAELDRHTIIRPRETALGVGAGAPPVATPDGLLLLFHERDAEGHYTAKAALLDHESGRVKAMLDDPIMRPELEWERNGDVDNVVFVQGAVPREDGTIYVTYGAADRHVGAALVPTAPLLGALRAAA